MCSCSEGTFHVCVIFSVLLNFSFTFGVLVLGRVLESTGCPCCDHHWRVSECRPAQQCNCLSSLTPCVSSLHLHWQFSVRLGIAIFSLCMCGGCLDSCNGPWRLSPYRQWSQTGDSAHPTAGTWRLISSSLH